MTCQFDKDYVGQRLKMDVKSYCPCGYMDNYIGQWVTYMGHFDKDGVIVAILQYDNPQICSQCKSIILAAAELCNDGGYGQIFTQKVNIEDEISIG